MPFSKYLSKNNTSPLSSNKFGNKIKKKKKLSLGFFHTNYKKYHQFQLIFYIDNGYLGIIYLWAFLAGF